MVDIELAGNRIISELMERLVGAVTHPELNYSRLLLSKFPQQYDVCAPILYGKLASTTSAVERILSLWASSMSITS